MHGKRWKPLLLLLALTLAGTGIQASATGIDGLWSTQDDKTHKPRGVVRIYEDHGEYFGKIVSSFDPRDALEICSPCSGAMHNKPVIGLVILRDMKRNGNDNDYTGGTIVDPDTGDVYKCKMSLEDGGAKLVVRGYIGMALFGRSQVWTRYTPPPALRETGGE